MAGFFDWFKKAGSGKGPAPASGVGAQRYQLVEPIPIGGVIGGEYTVHEVHQGGMGNVYVVTHREHPEPVILKEPQLRDDAARKQFIREAEVWVAAGMHPNVVEAFWVREWNRRLYIGAQFIAADERGRRSLRDWLREGPLPPELSLTWLAHAIYGLRHAAAQGVSAHRDIKPENLLIEAGQLKVTDFGLARRSDAPPSPASKPNGEVPLGLTTHGGTLGYMAPEQMLGLVQLDHRADIYPLGVTLFEMVHGRHPFAASTLGELIYAHLRAAPEVPDGPFRALLLRCMEKDPARRPQNYDQLLSELQTVASTFLTHLPPEKHYRKDDAEVLFRQAQSWSAMGRPDRAMDAAAKFIRAAPTDARGYTELGRLLHHAGRLDQALAVTERSIDLNPTNSHAWNNLGLILSDSGNHAGAVHALEKAIELDPGNTGAMLNIGTSLSAIGRSAEGIDYATRATRLAPQKAGAWNNLGALQLETGQYDAAVTSFRRALEIDPGEQRVAQNLKAATAALAAAPPSWQALLSAGRPDEASALLEAAVRRDPTNTSIWHNMGLIAMHRGDNRGIIRCFSQVEILAPMDRFALKQLAKAFARDGQIEAALQICHRMEDIPEAGIDGLTIRAQILDQTGNHQVAVTLLRDFLTVRADVDLAWYVLGEIHVGAREFTAAIHAFERAERLLLRKVGSPTQDLNDVQESLANCRRALAAQR